MNSLKPEAGSATATGVVNSNIEAQNISQQVEDWQNFLSVKVKLNRISDDFKPQQDRAALNRETRYKDLDLAKLRSSGIIAQDDFMIPVRAIDSNIRREHPLYVNYFRQSRRLAIFEAIKNKSFNAEMLEAEFTRGLQYSGWEIPLFKVTDGSITHGWDSVEVVLDETKPFGVAIEHIGNDMLLFPRTSRNIQFNECLMRKFTVYPKQLKNIAKKFNFNTQELDRIINEQDKNSEVEKTIVIYKLFYKFEGFVWVAWYECRGNDWLKAPEKLYLGKKEKVVVQEPVIDEFTGMMTGTMPKETMEDMYETLYPIFLLPYYETEQALIFDHVGRVFLDKHKQEAKTANISQFLSGCQRSSKVYPALAEESGRSATELENFKIENGKLAPFPIKFWSMPYPDQAMLNLQYYLDTFDSQEAGQINFAVTNRKDSRKTATETQAAQIENDQLKSVQVVLFSTFLREIYTFIWGIVKSKAIVGSITFLWSDELQGNDIASIDQDFTIKAAGDIDVIKRQEQLQTYNNYWPYVANTPIALNYLADMLKLAFPLDGKGEAYSSQILAGDPKILIQQLLATLTATIDTEDLTGLDPEAQMNLQNLVMQAQQYLAAGQEATSAAGNPQAPEESMSVAGKVNQQAQPALKG